MAEHILNKEAGWRAMTGTTDFGVIAASADDDPRCRLAFDLFVDRVCAFVGAYYVALRGQVDALVFAGGIGERSDRLRRAVVEQCACLGFAIDAGGNDDAAAAAAAAGPAGADAVVWEVGRPVEKDGRTHRVLVVRTDEQLEMARAAAEDPALWAANADDDEDEENEVPDLTLLRVKSGHN